jgi:formiminotetrahydrofolate cyclodeaminase
MSKLFEKSLREVIEVSASKSPTPGGGSVSAIVACFGLAMASMVANLTLGKEKYKDVAPQIDESLKEINELIKNLEELVEADMAVFNNFMKAYRLKGNTGTEKVARENAIQKALQEATDTPIEIARLCLKVLHIAERLSVAGNKMAVSDAGVAALLADAALKSVLLNVDINLPMIKDQKYVNKVVAEKEDMISEAGYLREKALTEVQRRI